MFFVLSVCPSARPFVRKKKMSSAITFDYGDRAFIFQRPFHWFQVICRGEGQYQGHIFSEKKMAITGALVFHRHNLFSGLHFHENSDGIQYNFKVISRVVTVE